MTVVLAFKKATLKYIFVSMNEFYSIMPDGIIIITITIINIHYGRSFLPLSLHATIQPVAYSTTELFIHQEKLSNNWWNVGAFMTYKGKVLCKPEIF